jgi:hypothetical protein
VALNQQYARGEFPKAALNDMRINAVTDAINSIETATTRTRAVRHHGWQVAV